MSFGSAPARACFRAVTTFVRVASEFRNSLTFRSEKVPFLEPSNLAISRTSAQTAGSFVMGAG